MPLFQVIVHETVEVTYSIEAETASQAAAKYHDLPDSVPVGEIEPDRQCLGGDLIMVIDPDGEQIEACDMNRCATCNEYLDDADATWCDECSAAHEARRAKEKTTA